jgi:YD repeat-containing protein
VRSGLSWWYSVLSGVLMLLCLTIMMPGAVFAGETAPVRLGEYEWLVTDNNGDEVVMASFPLPPQSLTMTVANEPEIDVPGATSILSDVPAFYWSYGCSATSAAMLFGYYDRIGYNNMYTGPTNGGVCPLDNSVWGQTEYPGVVCGETPLSATHNGIDGRVERGHVDDYWVDADYQVDPYAGHWTEHTIGTCTADYMGTNQWKYGSPVEYNSDGGTIFFTNSTGDPTYDYSSQEPTYRDGGHGMKLFAESRGYTVTTIFNQRIQGQGTDPTKGFTFADFQSEIDAGRPVLIHVVGHSMVGYGYNTTGNLIYIHDTWDHSSHTMIWGGTYAGMQHRGVTVIRLQVVPPTITNSSGASNVSGSGARLNGEVAGTGGANPTVHIYWGTADGGTSPGTWAHDVNLGSSGAGAFYTDISGLTVGNVYWYRCYGVNAAGASWASSSTQFTTSSVPTMEPIVEPQGHYYNTPPVLSNFGFDDALALDDGWYQVDLGSWTALFTNDPDTSWDNDGWAVPGFAGLGQGSHTVCFKASNDAGGVEGESGEWSWQFYKDTVAPSAPGNLAGSPARQTWTSDNTVAMTWTAAADATAGIDGYAVLWDTSPTTDPGTTKNADNVTTVTSPPLASGDSHYFHIRAVDCAQNWGSTSHHGPFFIDTVAPGAPTNINSTSHTLSTWSSDDTVTVGWTSADDNVSGLAGYSTWWGAQGAADPETNLETGSSATSITSSALAGGNGHYFHIRSRDNAGNWGPIVNLGPFWIDTAGPDQPAVVSTSPVINAWSNDNTIAVTWSAAVDALSGLDGYSVEWSTSAATVPNQTRDVNETVTSAVSASLPDSAQHYFHVRPVDKVGNWGTTLHAGPFKIETVPPSGVTGLASTSHTVGVWSNSSNVSLSWTAAVDASSGIGGYSVVWNTTSGGDAPAIRNTDNVTSLIGPALADSDSIYVHIRTVDVVGNWAATTQQAGPFKVETVPPAGPTNLASTSHLANAWSANNTVTVTWSAGGDATSGLAGYSTWWGSQSTADPNANLDTDNVTTSAMATLPDGANVYFHIRARDMAGNWGSTVASGPYMISVGSPVLSAGAVSPTGGYLNTIFTFSVGYSHPLGLAPGSVAVSIDGGAPRSMDAAPGQSGNFTQGQAYSCNVTNLAVGNHSFVFSASDNASTPRQGVGDIETHFGPSVQSTPIPPPSGGGPSGGGGGGGALPGYVSLAPYLNDSGWFNMDATVRQEPLNAWLTINKGATGKTASGTKLTQIGIFTVSEGLPPVPSDSKLVGSVYEFLPEGATFTPAANLWIRFDLASLPAGMKAADIMIARWDGSVWVLLDTTVNAADGTATAPVLGLGRYTLIGKPVPPPTTTPPPPVAEPARFTLTDVKGGPIRLLVDEVYSVSGKVANTGGSKGSYEIILKLDGTVKEARQILLDSGASTTVAFSFSCDSPGSYNIDLNGNMLSFTVDAVEVAPQSAIPNSQPATGAPVSKPQGMGVFLAAIGGLIVLAAVIVLLVMRRRK